MSERTAESESNESRQLVDLALGAAGMGWGAWNLTTGRAEVDPRARALLGFEPTGDQLTVEGWLEHVYAEDRPPLEAAIRAGATGDGALDVPFRIVLPDGRRRHLRATGAFVAGDQGSEPRLTAILRDETERLSNEQSLPEARENLQQALWSADIGWGVVDLDSGAFEPDARARAILGFTSDEPLNIDTLLTLIHPDDVPLVLADLATLLESRVVAPLEYRIVRRDGHVRTIRGTGLLRYDAAGRPWRITGTLQDITDRRRDEEALRALTESLEARVVERTRELEAANLELTAMRDRFSALFETSPVPTVIIEPSDRTYLDANPAFLDFLGVSREHVIGRSVLDLVVAPTEADRDDMAALDRPKGGLRDHEMVIRLHNGEERTLLVSDTPIYLRGERCTLATLIDITPRKRAEEQIRYFASQLSLAEQAERQRIAAILHDDLQQRLFALQVRLTSASAWVAQGETEAATAEMEQMRNALANAIDLTRRLTVDLSPPILYGEGLYHAIVWLGSRMREEYELVLTVQQETAWRPLDPGMRAALFQIVRELLFNVVKHAGVGAATVSLSQTQQTVTLVVSDAGVGFDAEQATTDGQGLRQARQRVELYGGRLKLDTRRGAGTTVTITVPLPPT